MKSKFIVAGLLSGVTAVAGAQSVQLEEIVVTAQKRAESLQDVPVSVTAITADVLASRNLTDINQISLAAPSLQLGQDNTFSIRGAGTLAFANTLDSSVATSIDEVNLGRRFLTGAIFNDVAQIEVLNGPQGLLFGKNASAGLLNITTTKPKIGVLEGKADIDYAVRDTTPGDGTSIITKGTLNLPVNDASALRFNAHYATQDPVAKPRVVVGNPRLDDNTKNFGFKAKYLLEASDALSIYVIGDYNKEEGIAGNFDRTFLSLAPGSVNAAPAARDGVTPGPENLEYGLSGDMYRDVKSGGLQAKLTYTFANNYELTNVAAWKFYKLAQNLDTDFSSSNGLDVNYSSTDYDQYSNELRLATPASDRLSGQVGLYYFDLKLDQQRQLGGLSFVPPAVAAGFPFCVNATVTAGPPPACSVSRDYFLGSDGPLSLSNQSIAAFGQFDFKVTDALKLLAGARFTRDEISIDLGPRQRTYFVALGAAIPFRSQSDSNNNVSWKVGAQYTFNTDVMSYLTVGRGYKGPGYTDSPTSATSNLYIKPETADTIEVGVKSSLFERRMNLNVSLFHQTFKDYQVQAFDTSLVAFTIQNAAKLTAKGAEINIEAKPISALTLNGAVTLLDSKFDQFDGAQCYPGQPNCVGGVFDAAGYQTPLAAKFTSSLQAMYEFPLASAATGFVELNHYYRSSINFKVNRAPGAQLGGTSLLGASIGAILESGWKFSLYCKNCTDKKVSTFIDNDAADANQANVASYVQAWGFNSVRNIGLTAAYKF